MTDSLTIVQSISENPYLTNVAEVSAIFNGFSSGGSAFSIGHGIFITADHVTDGPTTAINHFLHLQSGFTMTTDTDFYAAAQYYRDLGPYNDAFDYGQDAAILYAPTVTGVVPPPPEGTTPPPGAATSSPAKEVPLIFYADNSEAEGQLYSAGYPGISPLADLYSVEGTLSLESYVQIMKADPNDSTKSVIHYDGWRTDAGFTSFPGQSGSGVILTTNHKGASSEGSFYAGILIRSSSPTSGGIVETVSDFYHNFAEQVFGATNLGLSADIFETARNRLIADYDGSKLVKQYANGAFTDVKTDNYELAGTAFHEDFYTVTNYADQTKSLDVKGEGGDDKFFITEINNNMTINGGTDADGMDVDQIVITADLIVSKTPFLNKITEKSGTISFNNGKTISYSEIENPFKISGLADDVSPPDDPFDTIQMLEFIDALNASLTTPVEHTTTSGEQTVTPVGFDILPLILFALGVNPNDPVDPDLIFSPTWGFVIQNVLNGLNVSTTLTNFTIDFGPGISADNVTQEQVGSDLVFNVIDNDGTSSKLTVEGVYADGNADEIVAVNFADGTSLDLIDIPEPSTDPTEGNDVLVGTEGNDVIDALGGNDVVDGLGGNDHLLGRAGDDVLNGGDGNDRLTGGDGADVLNGGAGRDSAEYAWSDGGVNVNLTTGAASGAEAAGDTFVSIENIYGSNYNDVLVGSAANNSLIGRNGADNLSGMAGNDFLWGGNGDDILSGGDGADILRGGAGADQMDGGANTDTVDYRDSTAGVTVNLLTGLAAGGYATGDILAGFERIIGSHHADDLTGDNSNNLLRGQGGNDVLNGLAGNDSLFGNDGNDTLNGGDGADVLYGGAGADVLNGGAGNDYAAYLHEDSAVTVNLYTSTGTGAAAGDVYNSIESILGSSFDDVLTGDNGNNVIRGWAGADTIDGLGGVDLLDYRGSTAGVNVSLASGTGTGGHAEGDTFTNMENIYGSTHNDQLNGDDGNNTIYGWGGDDILAGGLGNDRLFGGNGNDKFFMTGEDDAWGGAGADTFAFFAQFDGSAIKDFENGSDIIDVHLVEGGAVGSMADIIAIQNGSHVELSFLAGTIIVENTLLADIDASDFIFGSGNIDGPPGYEIPGEFEAGYPA